MLTGLQPSKNIHTVNSGQVSRLHSNTALVAPHHRINFYTSHNLLITSFIFFATLFSYIYPNATG